MNCLKIEVENYRTFNCDLNVFLDKFNSKSLLKNRIKKIDKNNWLKKKFRMEKEISISY